MTNNKIISVLLIVIILLFFIGCTSNYTIRLIEEDTRAPVPNVPIELSGENEKDKIVLDNNKTDTDGQFQIPLKEIPGDSFLVSITEDRYFNIIQWISTPDKGEKKEFILEKRGTIMSGYVSDDSTYAGIPDCEITTRPNVSKKLTTDENGRDSIKSDKFAEGVSYTIIASKPPDYVPGATEIIPVINKKQDLEYPIYLEKAVHEIEDVKIDKEKITPPGGIDPPIN